MLGSEKLAKDCLEYVVFENHLADTYGRWRIHGKIFPDWMPPRHTILRTQRKPDFPQEEPQEEESSKEDNKETVTPSQEASLATA